MCVDRFLDLVWFPGFCRCGFGAFPVPESPSYKDDISSSASSGTYDHRVWRTGLPVRSAVLKPIIVRGQFSMRPEFKNGVGFDLRVSVVGDIGEKLETRGFSPRSPTFPVSLDSGP